MADRNLAAPCEVVAGVLHAGTKGILAAPSKIGKTWLLLAWGISVATGRPFLKWLTNLGRVLFINLEIPRVFMKQRLDRIAARMQVSDLSNLSVWTLRGHSADVDSLVEDIIERIEGEQYSLIILDPIYKLMIGRGENTSTAVNVLCHQIEQVIESTGAAVVYAHHFTKGNAAKKKAMDRLSGSGVFARDADTIITLTEHEEPDCYTVEMTLRNLPPQEPFVVQWAFPVMVERPDLDPAQLKRGEGDNEQDERADQGELLLGLLDNGPLTGPEWEKAAVSEVCSRATYFRIRAQLQAAKRVVADPISKTWTRTTAAGLQSHVSAVKTGETETPEPTGADTSLPGA